MFQLHFMTKIGSDDSRFLDFNSQEDWKAAIYAWGGPKPSQISKVEIEFDKVALEFNVYYLEKRFDHGLQQERSSDQQSETSAGSDGPSAGV